MQRGEPVDKSTVAELYESLADFEKTLAFAEKKANSEAEDGFVARMKESYATYKARTRLSERQYKWLNDIANRR